MLPSVLVIAKSPQPGRVKTRLCPPCTPHQAAAVALAALRDTLGAVSRTPCGRRILVLDGEPGPWVPAGFEVIPQRGHGLDERLAAGFADVGEPAFLVGMDTPQVTPEVLTAGVDAVSRGMAAFGAALDGGYWGIGLSRPDASVFAGVPMSSPHTGAVQRTRLAELGLETSILPAMRDVDTFADALTVAGQAPHGEFATAVTHVHAALVKAAA